MEHTFKGILMGSTGLLGVLDGEPRLIVARPGNAIVTDPGDGSARRLHPDVIADTAKIAFDSNWLDVAHVIAEGTATLTTSDLVDGYALLVSFADPGFVPVSILTMRGGPLNRREDFLWGGNHTTTAPGVQYEVANFLPTRVDRTSIRVRFGNGYNGYWYPPDSIHYLVLGTPAV